MFLDNFKPIMTSKQLKKLSKLEKKEKKLFKNVILNFGK